MKKIVPPLVSICVPVYGVEKYIGQCVESLMNQTYNYIEYIFVDDCTTDDSINVLKEVITKYPNRLNAVSVLHHNKNIGLAGARNTAVSNAKGEYIFHIDSDDWLDETCIEDLVKFACEHQSDFVSCGFFMEYENQQKEIVHPYFKDKWKSFSLMVADINIVNHQIWGNLIKTSLYKINQIEATVGVNQSEDYAVMPRLFYFANNPLYLPKAYLHYRQNNENSYMNNSRGSLQSIAQLVSSSMIIYNFLLSHNLLNEFNHAAMIKHMNIINLAVKNKIEYGQLLPANYFSMRYLNLLERIFLRFYLFSLNMKIEMITKVFTKLYIKAYLKSI